MATFGRDDRHRLAEDEEIDGVAQFEQDALRIQLDQAELRLLQQRQNAEDHLIQHKLTVEYVADERIKSYLAEIIKQHRAEIEDTVSLVRAVLAGECPLRSYYKLKQIRPELLTTR